MTNKKQCEDCNTSYCVNNVCKFYKATIHDKINHNIDTKINQKKKKGETRL